MAKAFDINLPIYIARTHSLMADKVVRFTVVVVVAIRNIPALECFPLTGLSKKHTLCALYTL